MYYYLSSPTPVLFRSGHALHMSRLCLCAVEQVSNFRHTGHCWFCLCIARFPSAHCIVPPGSAGMESMPGEGCHALCHIELVLILPQPQDASVVFLKLPLFSALMFVPSLLSTCFVLWSLLFFSLPLSLFVLALSDLSAFLSPFYCSLFPL